MKRRWIIRNFFIGLLLLCVGGWVWSAAHYSWITFYHGGKNLDFSSKWGVVRVVWSENVGTENDWACGNSTTDITHFWPTGASDTPSFYYEHVVEYHYRYVNVPHWFLILLSSAVLFVVWRKTRLPVNGHAFPVGDGTANGGTN
jgi:hypothetical protein